MARRVGGFMGRRRRPELIERAREIRAHRGGPAWTRLLGWMLLVLAGSIALDPDYPLPRHLLASSSAGSDIELRWPAPRAVFPVGSVHTGEVRFQWSFGGPPFPFEVVLLDAEMNEFARLEQTDTGGCRVDGPLAELLRDDGHVHWYIQARVGNRWLRSAPAAACFSR